MAVEVRQLVVKGEIQRQRDPREPPEAGVDLNAFRQQILEECRRLVEEALEQRRER